MLSQCQTLNKIITKKDFSLVSLNNLIDYFDYDSYNMSYSNGIITYKLGDKVTVVVLDADRKSRKIDFMFKADYLKWRNYNEGYLYK